MEIVDDTRKWWKARNWRGQMAHVPHTIVEPLTVPIAYPIQKQFTNGRHMPVPTGSAAAPPPPPPPPPPTMVINGAGSGHESGEEGPVMMSAYGASAAAAAAATEDWVRRERQGKKGEFRYF